MYGARWLLFSIAFAVLAVVQAQEPTTHVLYNSKGKPLKYKRLLKDIAAADVVLFGELHNNPVAHWMQGVVLRDMATLGPLVLGMEMLEADDQATVDDFMAGRIGQAAFDSLARLWNNHATDYAPLLEMARLRQVPVVATNVPRRYARMVARGGFEALDTLDADEKAWIAPLPIAYDPELPGYRAMLEMMGDHASPNMPKAQALKDATMAHFLLQHHPRNGRSLHLHGTYHSDNREGIAWYLRKARPDLRVVIIATVTQDDPTRLEPEHIGRADAILCVDGSFPTSY
jgi:uncharacterized iron-regulated protein